MSSFSFFPPASAHFVGIGGVGMAGLAHVMHRLGWRVSGCDCHASPYSAWLEATGIEVAHAHEVAHVASGRHDLVVRTPAVPDDEPEIHAAVQAHVPVWTRGEVLAAMSELFSMVAVCGSHGKTTTATFLSLILHETDDAAGWCIGGRVSPLSALSHVPDRALGQIRAGAGAEPKPRFVVEADESDGTLALYHPSLTVLTNVELDHVDHFGSVEAFEDVFRSCMTQTAGPIVYCADPGRAAALVRSLPDASRARSFGFSEQADFRVEQTHAHANGSDFALHLPGGRSLTGFLPVPGRHNLLNAAAAIAAADALGVPAERAAAILSNRAHLPDRRFQFVGNPDGFQVLTDYAHHPTEIRVLIETASCVPHKRMVAVFQPHRPSRTQQFLETFPDAFRGVNELLLCPVFSASEPPIPGGSIEDLYAAFRRNADMDGVATNDAPPLPRTRLADSLEDAFRYLSQAIREGDLVLVIGAGDVDALAPRLAALPHPPAAGTPVETRVLSGFGTEAPAPRFREIHDEAELVEAGRAAARAGEALAVIGAGTNTLLSETGYYGPLIRLARSETFSCIIPVSHEEEGVFDVGAATPGPSLLQYCKTLGWSGLEFMAGIPGSVGGWCAMNAGTPAGAFCDVLTEVRLLDADNVLRRIPAAELRPGYRETPGLKGRIIVCCRIRLRKSTPAAVQSGCMHALHKRLDFHGIRTCGSVFRNPPKPMRPAGMLSEMANCKRMHVGGAFVSERHANIVGAGARATASDVVSLIRLMRRAVALNSGVVLTNEIKYLHGDRPSV